MGRATAGDVEIGVGIDCCHHFVDNEEVGNSAKGRQSVYSLSTDNVQPGTLIGSIYLDGHHLGLFMHRQGSKCALTIADSGVQSVAVNCRTGKVTVTWTQPIRTGQSRVVMSYEYLRV